LKKREYSMTLPPACIHPEGEAHTLSNEVVSAPMEVDTFAGKLHIEWDPDASVTPMGQLPFFIEFLKLGHRLMPWVEDCPLAYLSNNAPKKLEVLGSLLLSFLSGHRRYAHISTLLGDTVNPTLLGMGKIVSDDSARRGLKKIPEGEGIAWLQRHLSLSYAPLLETPWILDTDVTVKPLYGHQEGAKKGYNPHKPGRPSHTYHTYLIANLRLVLEVEVQAGDQAQSSHSLPGLIGLLDRLPVTSRPAFIRGDCDWGHDKVMTELEAKDCDYLFKLKKSKRVKELIGKHHGLGEWASVKDAWEAKEAEIQLSGWEKKRRVVLVRRRLSGDAAMLGLEHTQQGQRQLEFAFVEMSEDMRTYEYSVLVTSLKEDVRALVQHYRDRADCENYFDEIKNQWGWGGFTTKDIKSCRLVARMIALVYNWWTLFVRLANPDTHMEAITSRPLLLTSIGRLTQSGRQKKMIITSQHGKSEKIRHAYQRLTTFVKGLKDSAPQLTPLQSWCAILVKAMEKFKVIIGADPGKMLPAPT
jgi:hypothetical protein